ncbi:MULTISPECIES: glucans biosynthesis glucosyltransferase MdoH [Marinomonas]|uniref:Glucans biosynthesis glucosyltransferase H n=1 Tax=Marinomonas arctica TaxID=383750 RepID=A0A7H1J9T3_9GAMM|nr:MULTISPECIES: glucans biosynthesis glucosyltransferase MdoH [Marinomonas]MCS7485369.1 glucosyl transferase [Marinomonas sp. BSi20414]QNT07249.1 glucans biosynthesis glucosyltransferase MdoH [Marinomonas arctica]GGN24870.1 glucans biosynthesis glucosyltransferase H [Marinomonas arctica]
MLLKDSTLQLALPKTSPLDMPRHAVNEASQARKKRLQNFALTTFFSRLFVLLGTVGLSWYGATEMYDVLNTNAIAGLQWAFLVLFCINFTWISFAFSQATLGLLFQLWPFSRRRKEQDVEGVTAILLPVYNEDPLRIRANIQAMREDLLAHAPGKFAFFILSDTNKADAWIAEEQAFYPLLNEEGQACPIYYRRRYKNAERKAGNIAEWVTSYGGDYECMIVLDADSLMGAECLISLTRRMAAEPGLGLIQTLPTIIRANTLYSRIQQFANHCFGPIYASGLAAWHGYSSNFWGHNAIIRTKAFADACGLPMLEGKAPFGGHVMSHDFMEAALLRRAGWGVRFDTDLKASYEEAPPSLVDVIVRDRRWCQGNLQHKAFVFAKGFHFATRLHLMSGIMSYLSAMFWLMLIVVGFALAVQAYFVRPEYFANPSLFPTWPVFDFEKARSLFILSMALVLAPKVYGWLAAMLNIRRCMQFGGPILLTLSTLVETLLSALYAPILMLSQFQVVYDVFKGRDSGWKPQSRDDGATSWKVVARAHFSHTVLGFVLAAGALFLSRELFYWSLPISFGLILSIPLSWLSGGAKRGNVIRYLGLMRAPEEKRPHPIVAMQHRHSVEQKTLSFDASLSSLKRLVSDSTLFYWHLAQMRKDQPNKEFCRAWICAEWQILNSDDIQNLLDHLNEKECLAILEHRELMSVMQKYLPKNERVSELGEALIGV